MPSPFFALRPLILASASPRRQAFLHEQGIPFRVLLASAPEPLPAKGEDPQHYALRTARHKAHAVCALLEGASSELAKARPFVLAADTIVVLDNDILGKPKSEEDAVAMLSRMVGRTHAVITACCLSSPAPAHFQEQCFADTAYVSFAPWPQELLRAYVATGEPLDKAGSYGIQGQGAFLVEHLEGSWSTVVGLPVSRVVRLLLDHGVLGLSSPQPLLPLHPLHPAAS